MKKKIIIPFLSIFALASCSVNINNSSTPSESTSEANASSSKPSATVNETSKIDVDLLALKNIASKYNDKESLSFKNYLTNALNLPIYNDDTIIYNNKVFKIEDNDVYFVKNYTQGKHTNEEASIQALASKNYKASDIIYVKSCDTEFEIVEQNSGLDYALDNGLYARPKANNGVINGSSLGLVSDSSTDNALIFTNIFDSLEKYQINTLVLDGGTYLCKNRVGLNNATNLTIVGNDSTILVNDSYDDSTYGEFFFNITGSNNILFSKLNFSYDMTRSIDGIKTQLGVHETKNLEIVDSKYLIPDTVLAIQSKDREFTNMDLYSNWENVIINNCSFTNLCDSEAGGCLWIRDFWQKGSQDCRVLNSNFYKIAHDEILAVFSPGKIDNVLIKGNKFTIPDDGTSSSVMNFTLGTGSQHTNITFEENNIDACSTGGLIWAKAENLIVRNNEMKVHLSKKTTGNFRVIEGQAQSGHPVNNVEEFSGNKLIVDSYLDDYSFQVHILHNINIVRDNEITVNLKSTDVMLDVKQASGNRIITNKYINYVFYNSSNSVSKNDITINDLIGTVFRYYGAALAQSVSINENNIKYMYEEKENENSCLIMLNDMKMQGFTIDFLKNNLYAKALNKASRTLFYAPNDDVKQSSSFKENVISGLNIKNNYLKNCEIEFDLVD